MSLSALEQAYTAFLRSEGLSDVTTRLYMFALRRLWKFHQAGALSPVGTIAPMSPGSQRVQEEIIQSLQGHWAGETWLAADPGFDPWRERGVKVQPRITFHAFPWGMREEIREFYRDRLEHRLWSLDRLFLLGATHWILTRFLRSHYPLASSFSQVPLDAALADYSHLLSRLGYREDTCGSYGSLLRQLLLFYQDRYDGRDEYEKDRWDLRKIPGVQATPNVGPTYWITFEDVPAVFRPLLKRYTRVQLANGLKAGSTHKQVADVKRFLPFVHLRHPDWLDLGSLARADMEAYYEALRGEGARFKERWYISGLIFVRKFLEYIQNAQYAEASGLLVSRLMFHEDIPYRRDTVDEGVRFIPEGVLAQLEEHVDELDRSQYIPIIVLLRATGWRIADILNLRYDNCLVEQPEGWYVQGEITKTGVLNHRVPVTQQVAGMLATLRGTIQTQSTVANNPDRYLFVNFKGRRRGLPYPGDLVQRCLNRLAERVPILDDEGHVFHFRNHAFRHSKAVELINSGMRLDLVQSWLAHASPTMTQVYAKLLDTTMRRSWEEVSRRGIFRLSDSGQFDEVDRDHPQSDNAVEWAYIRENLDAVRLPLGYCMKPIKLECKHQLSPCLTCRNLCTTPEFLPQFHHERAEVQEMVTRANAQGRVAWVEKNQTLLERYDAVIQVLETGQIHHPAGKQAREVGHD